MEQAAQQIDRAAGRLGYAVLRLCLGMNITMHGLSRLISGQGTFTGTLTKQFQHTFLPLRSVQVLGYGLPWAEVVLGILLLLGLWTQWALVGGGILMTVLTFGICLVQQWDIAGTQLVYVIAYSALLFLIPYNAWSVEAYLGHTIKMRK